MGLFSLLGKAAITIATNLDKVDNISEMMDMLPDKINQVKDVAGKAKNLVSDYQRKKNEKTLNLLNESIYRLKMTTDAMDYESTINVVEEKKLTLTYSIPPQYDEMTYIGNNMFSVNLNNKWGIVDINNQIVIPFEYEYIYAYDFDGSHDFIFPAQKNGKWGYINIKNETIIDFIYEDAWEFNQELAAVAVPVEDDYLYGYIDKSGNFILEPKYDSARSFSNNNVAIIGMYDTNSCKIKYGVINKSGGIIINCRYDTIKFESEYIICMNDIYNPNFFDYNGNPIQATEELTKRVDEIEEEKNMTNQAIICAHNKNVKNKIIPYFIREFKCGYFIETDEGSFCKIEPVFEEAYNQNDFGYARVKYNGLYGVINLNE